MQTLPSVAFSINTSSLDDFKNVSRSLGGRNSSIVIGDGVVLEELLTKADGGAGLPITMMLQIANEVGMITGVHLAATYLIEKLKNHKHIRHVQIGRRNVELNK